MGRGKFIDVTLRLIDHMSSGLNNAGRNLANHANQYTRAGRQIEKAGKNISAVGSKMTNALTVPIATAGAACVKLASDFESGMSKVQSISGATESELDKLSQKAKDMGATTKYSATEATEAYQYMAMAGWKTGDMLNGIEPIMKLAGATGEELGTTSDIVTDSLTAFGLASSDTQELVDVLAKSSASANTSVAMLGESFKYVAPVAGSLGYSVEDTSKMLGIMADSGIKASTAGTSLRSALSRMAAPTKDVQVAMNALGISLEDENGNMKSLDTVMGQMRESFGKLTKTQKAHYASSIAGKTGMAGLLAVVNSSDEEWNKMTEAMKKSTGAANDMYDVANDNLNGQLTVLKSTIESIAISFGEKLTPYVKKTTEYIQTLASKFNGLSDEQQNMIIKIALVAAAIGPALLVFGKTVTAVGSVVKAFGTLGRWFRTFGSLAGIITSPAGIVVGVLAAIAVAAFLIYKNWDKLKPTFEKVANAVKPAVEKISKVVKSLVSAFNKSLPKIQKLIEKVAGAVMPYVKSYIAVSKQIASVVISVLAKAFEDAAPVISKLGELFHVIFPIISSVVSTYINQVVSCLQKMAPVFEVVMSVCGTLVSGFIKIAGEQFGALMTFLGGIIDFLTGVFSGNWKKAWEGIKEIFSGVFQSFASLCKVPLNAVIGLINKAIGGINGISVDIPKGIPGVGGKHIGFSIPTIPKLAKGSDNWKGGIVQISEKGGEIVDLPRGSRVYPHDKSVQKAYNDGAKSGGNVSINIAKLADSIVVREEADIDKIATKLADKLERKSNNLGGGELGYVY